MEVKTFTPADVAPQSQQADPKIWQPGGPKVTVVSGPTRGEATLCLCTFSINGIEQAMAGFSENEADMRRGFNDFINRRNAHIRHEDARIIEMWFGVDDYFVRTKADEIRNKNKNGTLASDFFPDEPARILSQPITDPPDEYEFF